MALPFSKYQATGNDFILIDNRQGKYTLTREQIEHLCDRRFGIGADGIILIETHPVNDFNLVYFNRDGSQSLCGNGSRAAIHFASTLGILNGSATFNAFDGAHSGEVLEDGQIRIKLNDVNEIRKVDNDYNVNTGSPHLVRIVSSVTDYPVIEEGRKIRYDSMFARQGGTNVNFVELLPDNCIFVRTYERGVENETLSCGTGVTAAALIAATKGYSSPVGVKARGGELQVAFQTDASGSQFTDIFLTGPAKCVFDGVVEL